ncbi:hypothetical protein BDV95DRAFT_595755 [Massariosphaeria phaeospora]|uniref:Uncharacterized protein n=1 Tax=Massariosphaeria phaeospora TaxID=100035 RepID=A0A7C8M6I7_9PLEO|nr:hypothetical protein BDV95DRAFT_595755 [Massariosphaeria phaeospora]
MTASPEPPYGSPLETTEESSESETVPLMDRYYVRIAQKEREQHLLRIRKLLAPPTRRDAPIVEYSKAWHLQIASDICTKLPRELRDSIYDHLCAPDRLFDVQQPTTRSPPIAEPFTQPDFVGRQMAREVAETICRTCIIRARGELVASLWHTDLFGHKLVPRFTLRRLSLQITFADLHGAPPQVRFLHTDGFRKLVHAASRLPGFELTFELNAPRERLAYVLLRACSRDVFEIMNKGIVCKVLNKVVPGAYGVSGLSYTTDISGLFGLSPKECREMIRYYIVHRQG